ncbi:hypothetical protein Leryth_024795 [Lithospermum erythrorhizon]|nr:hypothetical protein Leryth_024795 [Lithospermum erythrorhizon]
MDNSADILEQLEGDMAFNILKCLNDPADLIRATGVSRFWHHFGLTFYRCDCRNVDIDHLRESKREERGQEISSPLRSPTHNTKGKKDVLHYVIIDIMICILMYISSYIHCAAITNGLSKYLCLKKFPELSSIECIAEPNCGLTDVGSSGAVEWEQQKREHNVYASLLQALNTSILSPMDCIVKAISASSTDNYPDESIINTLNPRDRYINRGSYWSSKGQSDPAVPETLIYNLRANLCVVTEFRIQPFEDYERLKKRPLSCRSHSQMLKSNSRSKSTSHVPEKNKEKKPGNPIYSAQYARIRMGHPKSPNDLENDLQNVPLQQPADDKFEWTYISQDFPMVQENRLQEFKLPEPVLCIGGVARVQVMGRALSPAFDVDVLPSGKFQLKYYPEALHQTLQSTSSGEGTGNTRVLSPEEVVWGRVGLLEYLIGGNQPGHIDWAEEDDNGDDDDEEDENDLDEVLML